jgi:pyruvate,water dikinase
VDLHALDDAALWHHLQAVDALGRDYFRPNIAISITQGVLHRTLYGIVAMLVGREQAPALYDGLTCFCETKTNLVNGDLYRLYRLVREEPGLERALRETERRALWESGVLGAHPRFAAAFARFIENHGHREVDFDAYVPTWIGQPWVVLENLRLMLMQGDVADPAEREVELRARQSAAEREYLAALPAELRNFGAELLRLTRAYTGLDDLEHYQTTRLSLPFRAAILEVGARLVRRGVLAEADDVFFLRKPTLTALMERGEGASEAAGEAARLRAEYDQARGRTPPRVHGQEAAPAQPGALRGLPGSPGVAEGPVCLVHGVEDFARFAPGSVLVARTTNPAWTPLFYSAVAVVTESGGPLSHGAVTAREVGVPAVMAVHGALSALRDGERVRVNGSRGTVEREEG